MGGNPADLVLMGGHAYLVDAARSWAGAVAVADGRIAAVGSDPEVSAHIGPHTEVIDLAGRMLLPGFTDSHVHASGGGLERQGHRRPRQRDLREDARRVPAAAHGRGGPLRAAGLRRPPPH